MKKSFLQRMGTISISSGIGRVGKGSREQAGGIGNSLDEGQDDVG